MGKEIGPFLEQSRASYPGNKGLARLVPPRTPGKEPEKRGRCRAGHCTITMRTIHPARPEGTEKYLGRG